MEVDERRERVKCPSSLSVPRLARNEMEEEVLSLPSFAPAGIILGENEMNGVFLPTN